MTYQELRQKYPKFIYEKSEYEIVGNNLEIKFYYSIPPDHNFVHKIIIENVPKQSTINHEQFKYLIFQIGLSIIPSYWKSTCSPIIEIKAGNLSPVQTQFWEKLFIKGMGEYYYKNQIDFTRNDFLTITSPSPKIRRGVGGEVLEKVDIKKVLVPVGGGKDSIVTLELLKSHYHVIPFIVNPVPIMANVIKTAGLEKPIVVISEIDPYLLELNKQGYLNGHIPLSAFYAFVSVLAANLTDTKLVAFSNERSSNEGNTTYLGQEINHQYSKSLEFETDFNLYLKSINYELSTINYFSFLRPLYELQITKLFCRYSQYFKIFSSCNRNFTINPKEHPQGLWCGKCPKCVSTSLMLSCFIGKDEIIEIMGSYPPDQQFNNETVKQLLGESPIKPFECVLTRAEAQAAYTGKGLDKLLSSWMDDPNIPKEFEQILKSAL